MEPLRGGVARIGSIGSHVEGNVRVVRIDDGKANAVSSAVVAAGGRLALRLYGFRRPMVCLATGHALAMGAILLLAADTRIGAEGPFKIGLNEVAIGLTLPAFGTELARDRLSRRHLGRAVLHAEIYDPKGAVDAGFLDRVVAPAEVERVALEAAAALASLDAKAFASTKRALRGPTIDAVEAGLEANLDRLFRT